MTELTKKLDDTISKYIRPITFPVGVKFLKKNEELPDRTKIPTRDFGYPIAVCQGMTLARKYGWNIAFYLKDHACPIADVILGYVEEPDFIKNGSIVQPLYVKTEEAGRKTQASTPKMPKASTECLLFMPLHLATLDPDVVVCYGNSAQVTRFVQAALYLEGGYIESRFAGRGACGGEITVPYAQQKCNVIIPGGGERIFALTGDDELAFAMPAVKFEDVMIGLEATHKGGVARIPTPVAGVLMKPVMPKYYAELEEYCGLKEPQNKEKQKKPGKNTRNQKNDS
jgi:uncharacterized protein (DUF169 family)